MWIKHYSANWHSRWSNEPELLKGKGRGFSSLNFLLSECLSEKYFNLYSWKHHFLGQHCGLMLPKSPSSFWGKWQFWCRDVPDQNVLLSPLWSDSSYLEVTNLWYSLTVTMDLTLEAQCLNSWTIHALSCNVFPANTSDVKHLWCKEKVGFPLGHYGKYYLSKEGQHLHL